jgi:hypothetical protein
MPRERPSAGTEKLRFAEGKTLSANARRRVISRRNARGTSARTQRTRHVFFTLRRTLLPDLRMTSSVVEPRVAETHAIGVF